MFEWGYNRSYCNSHSVNLCSCFYHQIRKKRSSKIIWPKIGTDLEITFLNVWFKKFSSIRPSDQEKCKKTLSRAFDRRLTQLIPKFLSLWRHSATLDCFQVSNLLGLKRSGPTFIGAFRLTPIREALFPIRFLKDNLWSRIEKEKIQKKCLIWKTSEIRKELGERIVLLWTKTEILVNLQ